MTRGADTESRGLPLAGVTVLITRTREQSHQLADPLEAAGAEVLAMPVIEIAPPADSEPLEAALRNLATYDWVVLTSTNGVERFFALLGAEIPAREASALLRARLGSARVAVVGEATARRLRAYGIEPDLIPADFRAEGLVAAFDEIGIGAGARVLIPRAAEAREVLPAQLAARGIRADAIDLYRLVPVALQPGVIARLAEGSVDVAIFASGATARHFLDAAAVAGSDGRALLAATRVASVGPVTTSALKALGIEVAIEAPEASMTALVTAISSRGDELRCRTREAR